MFIYMLKNSLTGKIYIGKAKNINRRMKGHQRAAASGKHTRLYSSIRKYGFDVFSIEVLCECETTNVDEFERHFIAHYNSTDPLVGYNLTKGGDGGDTFSLLSEEAKQRKLIAAANRPIRGISTISQKGRHITELLSSTQSREWKQNHKQAMMKVAQRRKEGNLTNKEVEGTAKLRSFWSSEEERKRRSVRSSGSNNSQYKGPYSIDGEVFEKIKQVRERFRVSGTINEIKTILEARGHSFTCG